MLHIAAHGRHASDNPMFSGLELADGALFGYDIDRMPRVPSTVVLSACEVGSVVGAVGRGGRRDDARLAARRNAVRDRRARGRRRRRRVRAARRDARGARGGRGPERGAGGGIRAHRASSRRSRRTEPDSENFSTADVSGRREPRSWYVERLTQVGTGGSPRTGGTEIHGARFGARGSTGVVRRGMSQRPRSATSPDFSSARAVSRATSWPCDRARCRRTPRPRASCAPMARRARRVESGTSRSGRYAASLRRCSRASDIGTITIPTPAATVAIACSVSSGGAKDAATVPGTSSPSTSSCGTSSDLAREVGQARAPRRRSGANRRSSRRPRSRRRAG